MRKAVLAVGILLFVAGCQKPPVEADPVSAYQSFAQKTQRDPASAYAALSSPSKKVLQAQADEISKLSGNSVQNDPSALLFPSLRPSEPLGDVKVLQQDSEGATLLVKTVGAASEVKMVKEGGTWKLDLTQVLSEMRQP